MVWVRKPSKKVDNLDVDCTSLAPSSSNTLFTPPVIGWECWITAFSIGGVWIFGGWWWFWLCSETDCLSACGKPCPCPYIPSYLPLQPTMQYRILFTTFSQFFRSCYILYSRQKSSSLIMYKTHVFWFSLQFSCTFIGLRIYKRLFYLL